MYYLSNTISNTVIIHKRYFEPYFRDIFRGMDKSTLDEFATKIALHCQKAARGMKARDKAQIKRWEKANVAAYRIQVFLLL